MAQQTLIGNDYGLLSGPGDKQQNATQGWEQAVSARPNFFANLLHRTLVAPGPSSPSFASRPLASLALFKTP